jgi:hypothetical protein
MKIYNYNPENGYFVGESFADESPLESGVYLIPAHATEIAAPKATKGKVVVWNGSDWELQDLPVEPVIDLEAAKAEAEAKAAQKAALLTQLGITEEQAKLLLS